MTSKGIEQTHKSDDMFNKYQMLKDIYIPKRVHVKRCNLMLNFWSAITAPIACSGKAAQLISGGKALGVENSGCHILAT